MWHICNRYQEQISKKYWAETKSRQLTLLRTWSYSYLTIHLRPLYIVSERPVINILICTKHYTTAFSFQFHMHWFFNKYKLDFCNNLSTLVVCLGATHKHNPVCQPQDVFRRRPLQPSENAPLSLQQSFTGMQTNSQRKQIWNSTG